LAKPYSEITNKTALDTMNVLEVPINGIKTNTGKKVPTNDPSVEIAYIFPDTFPIWGSPRDISFIANGEAVPNKVIGTLNKIITAVNEPKRIPNCS